jgi:hypothetical protein
MQARDAWVDPPSAGEFPPRPDKAKTVSGAMVALGALFLFFVPLGGALFLLAGVLGLTFSPEAPAGGLPSAPSASSTDQ